jgi:hypothetical protein
MEISEFVFKHMVRGSKTSGISAIRERAGALTHTKTHQHKPVTCAALLLTAISPLLAKVLFNHPPTTAPPTLPYTRRRQIDSKTWPLTKPLFFPT